MSNFGFSGMLHRACHLGFLICFFLLVCPSYNRFSAQESSLKFGYLSIEDTGIDFENKCIETPERCIYQYDYFYNGGGVALADFNNDGFADVFFTGNDVPNKLFLNNATGDLSFTDVSETAGISGNKWYTGVTITDINRDGWNDIYVCCSGPDWRTKAPKNELYVNNQNGTFTERAAEFGIDNPGLSTQAVFFDMDLDGDDDLFVLNHGVRNMAEKDQDYLEMFKSLSKEEQRFFTSAIYRRNGDVFVDETSQMRMDLPGFGLGVSVSDFDRDGRPDLFIANDYFIPDRIYFNQPNGQFMEDINRRFEHCSFYSMGCDAADVNNDQWPDLMVLDMTPADHFRNKMLMNSMSVNEFHFLTDKLKYLPQFMFNSLHMNCGYGLMSDIGHLAGVHQTDWSWAPLLFDMDNDGLRDLYVTNGYKRDVKNNDWRIRVMELMKKPGFNEQVYFEQLMKAEQNPIPNLFFKNKDGFVFSNETKSANLENPTFSNGAAYGDLDNDGDLDVVVNNLDMKAFVIENLINTEAQNHYLRIEIKGASDMFSSANSAATVFAGEKVFTAENNFTRGFQSYCEPILHFGLGSISTVDSVHIHWGKGKHSVILNPKIDERLVVTLSNQNLREDERPGIDKPRIFSNETKLILPAFNHEDEKYDDFQKEVLLPHAQSSHGPACAVGDVNGDGLDDFFVGNGRGGKNVVYIQQKEGRFGVKSNPGTLGKEILGATLFDADGDNDLDLYLACGGGGDFAVDDTLLQDELWTQDGKGNFMLNKSALPVIRESSKVVEAHDYDSDGDIDLFVGGRNVPGKYPLSPNSYFLENKSGVFSVDKRQNNISSQLGMVTDALWFDWEGDGDKDLLLVGEWMALHVFINDKGFFNSIELSSDLARSGWWYSIQKGDLDMDGKDDLLLGNVGWNNKFKPSMEKPLELYASDFDSNGTLDIVLSKYYKDKKVPVRGRECSSVQMPVISKKFPTFEAFASSSLEQIYSAEQLKNAYHLSVNSFSSVQLMNKGNGIFERIELPVQAQMAPIHGFLVEDFNGDYSYDIVLAGNNSLTEVETQPYDASRGLFLDGLEDGRFAPRMDISDTGLSLQGDVRGLYKIKVQGRLAFLAPVNNGRLTLIQAHRE